MLLERLESLVESVVEGTFGLILRGRIEPLEIARHLTREAEEQKIITLNRVYVPNRFTVSLHPADMATLRPIADELQAEFQRFVGEWILDRDYAVTAPIRVSLTEHARVGRNRIRIDTAMDDLRAAGAPPGSPELQVLPGGAPDERRIGGAMGADGRARVRSHAA